VPKHAWMLRPLDLRGDPQKQPSAGAARSVHARAPGWEGVRDGTALRRTRV
jgi:hypothetical protein